MKVITTQILYTTLLMLSLVTLISCGEDFFETNIEIDPPVLEEKIVGFAFINLETDELEISASVNAPIGTQINSRNFSFNSQVIINKLSTNESFEVERLQEITSINNIFGQHFTDDIPLNFFEEGEDYEFNFTDLDNIRPDATAAVTFPKKTTISDAVFEYEAGLREDGDEASSITITIEDDSNEHNFYEIAVLLNTSPTFASTIDLSATKGLQDDFLLIDDSSFNGESKELEIKVFRISDPENATYQVEFRDITEDYFKYSKTLKSQVDNEDNPFSSPVPVFSNVENGLGIISLFQEQVIDVK